MGQTSKYKIPYPDVNDIANVPGDLKTIAEKIEAILAEQSKKHIMTAGLTDNYTTADPSNFEKLKTNKVFCSCGDKLTITEEGIKIGDGVSKVKVSGQIYFYTNVSLTGDSVAVIYKNNNQIVMHNQRLNDDYEHLALPEKLIDVVKGDIINLAVKSEKTSGTLIKNYEDGTFLTVEVVE